MDREVAVLRRRSIWIAVGCVASGLLIGCRSDRSSHWGFRSKTAAPTSVVTEAEPTAVDSNVVQASHVQEADLSTTPPESESEVAEAPPPSEPFEAKPLCPISPAELLDSSPIPAGYQARLDELDRLGRQLAKASPIPDVRFQFESMYNPRRASTCHTQAGHILVTSAMLERVQTRHQLASALALEMARYIREQEMADRREAIAASGVPADAQLDGPLNQHAEATPEQIEQTASDLLARAGFENVDIVAMKESLQALTAEVAHTVAKPKKRWTVDEPQWDGPSPVAAN